MPQQLECRPKTADEIGAPLVMSHGGRERFRIRLVGPFREILITTDPEIELPERVKVALSAAKEFAAHKVAVLNKLRARKELKPIQLLDRPHVLEMQQVDMTLRATVLTHLHTYGAFAGLSTDEQWDEFVEMYEEAHPVRRTRCSAEELARWCRIQMPANATALVTSDNKLVVVQRSRNMLLHPNYDHCLGGAMDTIQHDATAAAVERVCIEAGITPSEIVGQPLCLGVSGNHPYDQPIFLFAMWTHLTSAQLAPHLHSAKEPDGSARFVPFMRQVVSRLRDGMSTTPSFRALCELMLMADLPSK
jgi:hypothetical protein